MGRMDCSKSLIFHFIMNELPDMKGACVRTALHIKFGCSLLDSVCGRVECKAKGRDRKSYCTIPFSQ